MGRYQKTFLVTFMAVLFVLSRFLPHPPNFTALIAFGFFTSLVLQNRVYAMGISLAVLFITDLSIGMYPGAIWNYVCLTSLILIGGTSGSFQMSRFANQSLFGVLFFFITSNLGVWLNSGMYSWTFEGLLSCYALALPFALNTLLGTAFYGFVMWFAHRALGAAESQEELTFG